MTQILCSSTCTVHITHVLTSHIHTHAHHPRFHTDAKTTAAAWPNLSSVGVTGRSYISDLPAIISRPQDDTYSEGSFFK